MTKKLTEDQKKKNKVVKKTFIPKVSADKNPEAKKDSHIVERPCVEFLPVALTGEEITAYAKESARLHGDRDGLEEEKKSVVTAFKGRIEAITTRITELNRKISGGVENRQVQCFWRIDYQAGKKTLFRTPMSPTEKPEEVTSYALSPDERQMKLPIAETKNDKAPAPTLPLTAKIEELVGLATPKPGDSTGTDEVRTPAAEKPEETKIRKWFNALSLDGRKDALDIKADAVLSDDQTRLPYKRLPEVDREIIRRRYAVLNPPF